MSTTCIAECWSMNSSKTKDSSGVGEALSFSLDFKSLQLLLFFHNRCSLIHANSIGFKCRPVDNAVTGVQLHLLNKPRDKFAGAHPSKVRFGAMLSETSKCEFQFRQLQWWHCGRNKAGIMVLWRFMSLLFSANQAVMSKPSYTSSRWLDGATLMVQSSNQNLMNTKTQTKFWIAPHARSPNYCTNANEAIQVNLNSMQCLCLLENFNAYIWWIICLPVRLIY